MIQRVPTWYIQFRLFKYNWMFTNSIIFWEYPLYYSIITYPRCLANIVWLTRWYCKLLPLLLDYQVVHNINWNILNASLGKTKYRNIREFQVKNIRTSWLSCSSRLFMKNHVFSFNAHYLTLLVIRSHNIVTVQVL